MKPHEIAEYLDRQAEALSREEAALAGLVAERLRRIGAIYARTRLAELLLEGGSGRVPEGVADPEEEPPRLSEDVAPPATRVMYGIEVPPGREDEARHVVTEAKSRASSRTEGARSAYDGRGGDDAWMPSLYRAAFEEAAHSEVFISDILASLLAEEEGASRQEGQDERVARLLADTARPMAPREIVTALGINPKALGPVMGKLCRAGRAVRNQDGRYVAG